MKLATAIQRATRHLIKSERARMYHTGAYHWREEHTAEVIAMVSDPTMLQVKTEGIDNGKIRVPQTRRELIALKCKSQMEMVDRPEIAKRYYLDILRREGG